MDKRGTVYIVDTENKHNSIMDELRNAGEMDDIILFEVGADPKLSLKLLAKLLDCKARVIFEKGFNGTPNALDMQVSSLLGFFIACRKYNKYVVVSGDNGFIRLADYWKNRGVPVHICDCIGSSTERIMSPTGIRNASIETCEITGQESDSIQELMELNVDKIGILRSLASMSSADEDLDDIDTAKVATDVVSSVNKVTVIDPKTEVADRHSQLYVTGDNTVYGLLYGNATSTQEVKDAVTVGAMLNMEVVEEKPQATNLLRKFPNVKDTKSEYERAVSRLLGATIKPEAKQFVDMLDELAFLYHPKEQASNSALLSKSAICLEAGVGKVLMNTLATLLMCTKDEEEFCKVATQAFKHGVIRQYGLNTAVDYSMFLSKLTQWVKKIEHCSLNKLIFSEHVAVEEN